MKHDAAVDWQRYGDEDPYFGVLSDPRFKGKKLDEAARTDFMATGERHADNLLRIVGETLGEFPRAMALDFGCGVGRLTQGLARHFATVVGLDVAEGMLAEARWNAELDSLANLEYHSSLDPSQIMPRSYDLVHSYIVLQHIPVEIGEPIVAKLVDAVSEGGVGALHMTIMPASGQRRIAVQNWIKRNKITRMIANVALRRPVNSPAMEMNLYRTERIVEILARSGIQRFSCLRVDDWGSIGLFILFKRDSGPAAQVPWSNPVRSK